MYVHVCLYVYVYVCVCVCVYIHMYMCICVYAYVCMHFTSEIHVIANGLGNGQFGSILMLPFQLFLLSMAMYYDVVS